MEIFKLAPQLVSGCHFIKELTFTSLLLYDDARFLWFIMVPKKPMLEEIYDLEIEEQQALLSEMTALARVIRSEFNSYKVNVASFGNIVRQLHIHMIGRYQEDDAWPKPVWCANTTKIPYDKNRIEEIKAIISASL